MAVYAVNFDLEQGTTFEEEFNLTESDGSPLNLVGYSAAAKIRKYPTSPKYKAFTITFIDRQQGRVKISLDNTQTAGLDAGRNYYDLLLTDGAGKITKIVEGSIIVNETATLGLLDSNNLDGLGNIDITNVQDGSILMYDAGTQTYVFTDPDMILAKAVVDDAVPEEFMNLMDEQLDNKIDLDSGEF